MIKSFMIVLWSWKVWIKCDQHKMDLRQHGSQFGTNPQELNFVSIIQVLRPSELQKLH